MRAKWAISLTIVLSLAVGASAVQRSKFLVEAIEESKDVAWLERLSIDVEFSDREYDARKDPYGGPKIARQAAYVRLGELRTAEGRAAIQRIESRLHNRSILPPAVRAGGWSPNPISHVGDAHWWSLAETVAADGYTYAVMSQNFYGEWSLFACRFERKLGRWSRPWLVPVAVDPWTKTALRGLGPNRLHATFLATDETQLPPPPPQTIDFAQLTVDTDRDGWTDVEETRLGFDPRRADSDNDGIPDGQDPMPLFAQPAAQPSEDDRIVQRAIFAAFGLTGAPHALFVDPQSRLLHIDSSSGPFLYGTPAIAKEGIHVGWRLIDKSKDRAVVEISDYEGPLSASTQYVVLERNGTEWFVVGVELGAIS